MDLKDKVVLITGSSRGLGACICYMAAKRGALVVINYNNSLEEANSLASKIEKDFSYKPLVVKCDVSNEEEVKSMILQVIDYYGKIDVLINNAGICNDSLFSSKTKDDFLSVLSVNLIGTFLVSKYAKEYMNEGVIVNISSDNALGNNYPCSAEYDASKSGVISLTHNMAKEYSPDIRVNCVCPGWMETDMNKGLDSNQKDSICNNILLKRFAHCDEVSEVALFLASDKARYVNDAIIKVNGGSKNEQFNI